VKAVQDEYMRLAAALWLGSDPLPAVPMKDRDIFDLLAFDEMNGASYVERCGEIHDFDRTAAKAWEVLTSTRWGASAPPCAKAVTKCATRCCCRGRPRTCADCACSTPVGGNGASAQEATLRCQVLAIDLSPTLVELARERHAQEPPHQPHAQRQGWQHRVSGG
jgi:hypothetical protein